jgi:hypothetical protein
LAPPPEGLAAVGATIGFGQITLKTERGVAVG